jgi:hypothetical protein
MLSSCLPSESCDAQENFFRKIWEQKRGGSLAIVDDNGLICGVDWDFKSSLDPMPIQEPNFHILHELGQVSCGQYQKHHAIYSINY